MMGTSGAFSRIALDTAIAERNCGPPITVTPTAETCPSLTARTAVETKSRSTLPSMIVGLYLPSSAADRRIIASGKRALRFDVIVGLMSKIRCKSVILSSESGLLRGRELEYGQPLVHEPALGLRRTLETASSKFFQEEIPVTEGRQHHQSKPAG